MDREDPRAHLRARTCRRLRFRAGRRRSTDGRDGLVHVRLLGERRSRVEGPRIALALGPFRRLAHELAQLGEERGDACTLALERLDPIKPGQHRARLLHVSRVGGRS